MNRATTLAEVQQRNSRAVKSALGIYFAAGFLLMMLLPEPFAADTPALAAFGRLLDAVIPGISRIAELSPFPHAMRTFLTAMWIALPLATYRIARAWTFPPRLAQLRKADRWFVAGVIWLCAIASALFLFAFFDLSQAEVMQRGGRGRWLVRLFTQERFGAALILPFWFCIVGACAGIAVRMTTLAWASSATKEA